METKLSTWCCLSKGKSKMKVYLEKNAYVQGETANLCCEIDNS